MTAVEVGSTETVAFFRDVLRPCVQRTRIGEWIGATEGTPKAQQVLDRWHVLKNVREVVQRIVSRNHAP